MSKSYQKEYRENMSDEQKQRYKDNHKSIEIILLMNKNKKIGKLIRD